MGVGRFMKRGEGISCWRGRPASRTCLGWPSGKRFDSYMSYSLNSLKGYVGKYHRGY